MPKGMPQALNSQSCHWQGSRLPEASISAVARYSSIHSTSTGKFAVADPDKISILH